MRYSNTKEKKQRFSFRKLSVGLVSAVVASVFLGYSDYSVQPVLATTQTSKEQLSAVGIYHTTENELTAAERERVIKAIPVQLEHGDEAYYFVYRPTSAHLPKTGELRSFVSFAGIGFLVLVATYHRKRRQWLLSVVLLSTSGALLLSTEAEALTTHVLARFNQTIQLSVGDKLPHPTEIDGYDYIGYLKITKDSSDLLVKDTVSSDDKKVLEEQVVSETQESTESQHRVGTSVNIQDKLEAIYSEQSVVYPVAFETQEVPSSELYEDERVTVQEGLAGERTVVTGTFTSEGEVVSEQIVSDSVTLAPRPEIIHVGTKVRTTLVPTDFPTIEAQPEAVYSEQSVVYPVAFDTQEVPSSELYEDERIAVQEGMAGERTVVTGTFTSEGEVVFEQTVSDSVTLAPQPEIIHVGTEVRTTLVPTDFPTIEAQPEAVYSEQSVVYPVAFETQEVPSSELYEDERVTVQEGLAGERTVVTGTFTSEGEVVSEQIVSDSVTLAPQPEIIHVGTEVRTTLVPTDFPTIEAQPEAVYSEQSVVYPVAFETQEVPSSELYEDERVTVQEGLAGERTVVTGTFTSEGEVVSEQIVSDSVTLAPRPEIIHVGTKVRTTLVPTDFPTIEAQPEATVTVETQTTPHETVYREDISRPAGEQSVSVTGIDGQKRLTKINGQVVQEEILQEVVTKEVSVGTQATSLVTSLPFEIEYISDPTRFKGSENVTVRSGVNGQKTVTTSYTLDTTTGQVTPNKPVETIIAPVNQIVSVGTKERDIPVLEIERLDKSVDERSVTAHFILRDAGKVALSAKAQLYKGDTLIKELPIPNKSDSLVINDLDYYTDYTLKTVLTYDLGDGVTTDLQTDTEDFRLDYKKIEIKDIDGINLYKKENDRYVRLFSLPNVPTELNDYFVKIESDRFKDILLPVTSVEASDTNTYRVKAHIPELVQGKQDTYQPDFTFEVAKSQTGPTQYATFKELVAAIKANPSGTFHLSSDISASDIAPDDSPSYIPETFTGVLTGLGVDHKTYAIYDLAKPLFATISGARVTDLDLKNVSIYTKQSDVAALAVNATNRSYIENVSVEGKLTADKNVAGLIAKTERGTTITNTAFTGTLRSLSQVDTENSMGGIVAIASLGSKLSKVRSDVNTYIVAMSNKQKAGSLVGIIKDNSSLSDSYATGNLVNSGKGGQIGGVVGSTWNAGIVNNVLSEVNVTNGNQVHGDSGYKVANIRNVSVLEGISGKEDLWSSQKVSAAAAQAQRDSLGITTTLADSNTSLTPNLYSVDYLSIKNAQADRATTYFNVEKLMPFYNKELVVYYGNKLDSNHKLAKVALVDVVPMTGNTIVTNVDENKSQINRIMLHYADNTVDYLDVSFKETFVNQHVLEYDLANTGLIYTPEELVSGYAGLVAKLSQTLSSVTFDSPAVRQVLNLAADNGEQKLSRLYLEETFNAVKTDLTSHLVKALAMNNAINTSGSAVEDYLFQKIAKDKEAFLLGLSYLQRWYNINYDSINTKDLSTYKFDFFGNQQASTIDEIIQLGKSGFQYLQANKNDVAYNHLIADGKQKDGLFNYLEAYRHLLTPTKSNADWFKDNTKAYIVENLSTIDEVRTKQLSAPRDSLYNHRLYNRLTQDNWNYRNMVLPLLTLTDESMYIIPSLSTISFGGYERYLRDRDALTSSDPKAYVRGLVDQAAEWHRDHFDFWYKILTPETRDKLARSVINYDGFSYPDAAGAWSWRTLDDDASSIKGFFGPVGKWYQTASAVAYANGSATHFISAKILERYGAATFTHEMVHNFDGTVYLEGYGRREGQGSEFFAEGLLQSPDYIEQPILGINHIFNNYSDSPERMHTYRPNERFKNAQDLQDYFKGVFDVMYLLDYAEAESLLKQPDAIKKQWFRKIENYYIKDAKTGKDTHAGNRISALTDEEVAKLTSLNSLITNNILARRDYSEGQKDRNGYYTISLTSPIYAALDNPHGAPGDIMFKRTAFELLAAKGYHEGFLPYVSGKLGKEALAEGSTIWSAWYRQNVPLITDKHVFDNVLSAEYSDWSDFKQKMFDERIAKKELIKPITIQYKLGDAKSTEEVTINSYSDLQTLVNQAVARDLKNMPKAVEHAPASWVGLLKKKIYNAYLRQTNDFRESIFK